MSLNPKLERGSNSSVQCRAEGQTVPAVRWSKVGHDELPAHIRDREGSLQFYPVRETDSGRYSCVASNEQGTINVTVFVDVVGQFTLPSTNMVITTMVIRPLDDPT